MNVRPQFIESIAITERIVSISVQRLLLFELQGCGADEGSAVALTWAIVHCLRTMSAWKIDM